VTTRKESPHRREIKSLWPQEALRHKSFGIESLRFFVATFCTKIIPMAYRTISALFRKSANYRRGLTCLLLLIITCGAIAESVHSHGCVQSGSTYIVAISNAGGAHSSTVGHSHETECSICHFQQQLFNGLTHRPLIAFSPTIEFTLRADPSIAYQQASRMPASGRAPPTPLV